MAKDKLTNLFAKTGEPETTPAQPSADGLSPRRKRDKNDPITSKGVGLRKSDWTKFIAIADELGTTYHELTVYILRDFMTRWDRGERPPTETKQVLKRP